MIDVHAHVGWHFDKDGRYAARPGAPAQEILYSAENAYVTLLAGFTTIQSPGQANDVELREAIARGVLPGPRILTSIRQINERSGTPDEIRQKVRQLKTDGADVIKIFASASIRDGGKQTMTDEQLQAVCGEANAQGMRTMVHAHSPESIKASVNAGCQQIEHGVFATDEVLKLMADKGVYFDPNVGVVLQNYLKNRDKYNGIGNYNDEGFAYMEKGLGAQRDDDQEGGGDAEPEDGARHRRGGRRARAQRRRDRRARAPGRSEADGRDHLGDVDGGEVAAAGQDDRHARAPATRPTSSRSTATR